MVLKLYKINGSPPVRAVLMTVEILGLNIETEEVNTLLGEQHKPEFLAKNPLHAVPLLEDGDFILSDSHAIITYLVSKYGADKRATLYPSDLRTRATIDQRLFFDATKLFPNIISIIIAVFRKGAKGPDDEQVAAVKQAYGYAEKYLERSTFIARDELSIADVSCAASVSTLNALVPIGEEHPKLKAWLGKVEEQDWYKKGNLPGLTQIVQVYNQKINKA